MTRALLDVCVLIALLDQDHKDHTLANLWWDANADDGWASCTITELGLIRIMSSPGYSRPVPVQQAVAHLVRSIEETNHEFWSCEVSALDPGVLNHGQLRGNKQLTDSYLLALAVAHDAHLVTFDTKVELLTVSGASDQHLRIIA